MLPKVRCTEWQNGGGNTELKQLLGKYAKNIQKGTFQTKINRTLRAMLCTARFASAGTPMSLTTSFQSRRLKAGQHIHRGIQMYRKYRK
jgi:hypothetical protein